MKKRQIGKRTAVIKNISLQDIIREFEVTLCSNIMLPSGFEVQGAKFKV